MKFVPCSACRADSDANRHAAGDIVCHRRAPPDMACAVIEVTACSVLATEVVDGINKGHIRYPYRRILQSCNTAVPLLHRPSVNYCLSLFLSILSLSVF